MSKSELINLLLKQEKKPKIIVADDTKPRRPFPTPRTYKSVKIWFNSMKTTSFFHHQSFGTDLFPNQEIKNHHKLPFPHQGPKKTVPEKRTIITQVEKALERLYPII